MKPIIDYALKVRNLRNDETQDVFAKSIPCSLSTIKKVENGEVKTIGIEILTAICKSRKVSVRYFLEESMTVIQAERLHQIESLLWVAVDFDDEWLKSLREFILNKHYADHYNDEQKKRDKVRAALGEKLGENSGEK